MLHNLYLISLIAKEFNLCFPIHTLNFSSSSKIRSSYTKVVSQDGYDSKHWNIRKMYANMHVKKKESKDENNLMLQYMITVFKWKTHITEAWGNQAVRTDSHSYSTLRPNPLAGSSAVAHFKLLFLHTLLPYQCHYSSWFMH